MTFTGKPSSACRTCRSRRIKCDEGRPSCEQCKKARRECLGYPDPGDQIFHNQTTAVIRRAKRIHDARDRHSSSTTTSQGTSPVCINVPSPTSTTSISRASTPFQSPLDEAVVCILPNPAIPIQTRALDFYLTIQLLEPMSRGRVLGHLDSLPLLYSQSLSTSALAKVTTAASVAALGIVGRDTVQLRKTAYQSYGEAILALAYAMRDDMQRRRNETLLACVLMVVVESMLAKDRSPNQQWAAHVGGAGHLLRQRGREDIAQDPVARRLWSVVRAFLASNLENKLDQDPMFGEDLPVDINAAPPPPEARLGMLTVAVTQIRERGLTILEKYANSAGAIQAMVQECQYIDQGLCAWALSVPQAYQYTSITQVSSLPSSPENATAENQDSSDIDFEVDHHSYSDPHLQHLWNSYRVARISLHALIYRAATVQLSECMDQNAKAADMATTSAQILQGLATDIVASIPPIVLHGRSASESSGHALLSPQSEIALAYYCLWPLYNARGVAILPAGTKSRIGNMMRGIVDEYAIQNGAALLELVESDSERPLWAGVWHDGWIESNWEWAFLYGCGAV